MISLDPFRLSEVRKSYFRDPNFKKKFLWGACPQDPPSSAVPLLPPKLTFSSYGPVDKRDVGNAHAWEPEMGTRREI